LPEWRRVYADETVIIICTPTTPQQNERDRCVDDTAVALKAKLMLHCNKIRARLVRPESRTATRQASVR
jgi:hypothetical protein